MHVLKVETLDAICGGMASSIPAAEAVASDGRVATTSVLFGPLGAALGAIAGVLIAIYLLS